MKLGGIAMIRTFVLMDEGFFYYTNSLSECLTDRVESNSQSN